MRRTSRGALRLFGAAGSLVRVLAWPAVWTLCEWARGRFMSGFPWLNLGYSQIDAPLAGFAPVLGVYGLSKAADISLARNLAVELGEKGIRANCICPGVVRTDFARALWEDPGREQRRSAMTPLRRIGEPDDVAGVAVMLAAPAGRFITGQSIVIDGGTMAGTISLAAPLARHETNFQPLIDIVKEAAIEISERLNAPNWSEIVERYRNLEFA